MSRSLLRALLSCFTLLSLLAGGPAAAAERLSERWDEKRAAALLERAAQHLAAGGEAALADFSRQGEFVDRDLYVYALAPDGRFLASGGSSAALIGQNVSGRTDSAGKAFFREILDTAARDGAGRVEYRWLNPAENREEPKVTLFRKVGDYIVAVGFYTPRASAAQAREMLARASGALAQDRAAALDAFQAVGGAFIQDDLYVFVVAADDGRFLAHGASPALVGRDARELRDPRGKPIISDMLNIARSKGEGQLEYAWRNPLTGKVESKTTFFRMVEGMLVGVGYYTR
ncbi:cache domain-containing protein [Thauera sp. CAU 1555]|uniref:Cache domain-containing protein n=1 Tax=Thauera sedimentorum TaxID=2767595 RepID=A0ABR9BCH7_9RHOO|nr:cache domain-containing protein [Thauera sedimentorum]MBC9073136.1 cache domain-containing protein [Thauera sedimentorum]MBD8504055.1 cache domain-containing protein [Thauera sedimentorum]